jgi:long-subunit acyl-CoA synthetase (AMP-forming)
MSVFISEIITFGEMTVKLNANEIVLKAGDTNQVIENQKVDGKLIVTNQRIYFKPLDELKDRLNIEILFENIMEVIFYNKSLSFVKGINVITRDGKSHSFPLKKRDEIGQLINRMY